jgi:predicted exporter
VTAGLYIYLYINTFSPYRAVNTLRLCYKTSQLMLYGEVIVVCSQVHTKHISTLCGQNGELVDVKSVVNEVTIWIARFIRHVSVASVRKLAAYNVLHDCWIRFGRILSVVCCSVFIVLVIVHCYCYCALFLSLFCSLLLLLFICYLNWGFSVFFLSCKANARV